MNILAITVPIYIVMGIGYSAGRAGLFSAPDMRVLGKFVVKFALPALLFTALSQRPIADIVNGSYLAAYAVGSLAVFAAVGAFAAQERRTKRIDRHRVVVLEQRVRRLSNRAPDSRAAGRGRARHVHDR